MTDREIIKFVRELQKHGFSESEQGDIFEAYLIATEEA